MNAALWIAQGVLAAIFLFSGTQKSRKTKAELIASGQTGVAPFPLPVIRFTAVMELCAVAGLTLPWATGIAARLTPVAAGGLAVIMVVAAWSHTRLGEFKNVTANAAIFAVCLFVIFGRLADLGA